MKSPKFKSLEPQNESIFKSPKRVKTNSFSKVGINSGKRFNSPSINSFLEKNNYTIESIITVEEEDTKEKVAKYIKSVSPNGVDFFIELDTPDRHVTKNSDCILVDTKVDKVENESSNIESIKNAFFTLTSDFNFTDCGVILIHVDNYHVLNVDDDYENFEREKSYKELILTTRVDNNNFEMDNEFDTSFSSDFDREIHEGHFTEQDGINIRKCQCGNYSKNKYCRYNNLICYPLIKFSDIESFGTKEIFLDELISFMMEIKNSESYILFDSFEKLASSVENIRSLVYSIEQKHENYVRIESAKHKELYNEYQNSEFVETSFKHNLQNKKNLLEIKNELNKSHNRISSLLTLYYKYKNFSSEVESITSKLEKFEESLNQYEY